MEKLFIPDFKTFPVVHCRNRLEAAVLLLFAKEHGYAITDDNPTALGASYSIFKENTCYEFRERNNKKVVVLQSLSYYESHLAEAVTFPEFILGVEQDAFAERDYNTSGMYITFADNALALFRNFPYPVFLLNEDGTSTELLDDKDFEPRKLYGIKQDDFNRCMRELLLMERDEEREV